MLQRLSKDIRECYHSAERCKCLAKTALTSAAQQDYLDMEQRWLSLARSYEFTEAAIKFHSAITQSQTAEGIISP